MIPRPPKRTRILDWLVCGALLLVSLFVLFAGFFGKFCGTTKEEKLVAVSGLAQDPKISRVQGRFGESTDFLWFTVDGFRVSFASDQNGFDRVLDAARSEQPITVKVSTERETLFPRKGWVPLYYLSVGDDVILTYEDTVTNGYRASNAPFIGGAVLLLITSWGLHRCYENRNAPSAVGGFGRL